ncbi:MAG: hypothetical protein J5700_06425, partial [Treponema sp.]|nr:hypothetical protein [Treponema sp.]
MRVAAGRIAPSRIFFTDCIAVAGQPVYKPIKTRREKSAPAAYSAGASAASRITYFLQQAQDGRILPRAFWIPYNNMFARLPLYGKNCRMARM